MKKFTRTSGGNWETLTYIDGIIEYRENDVSERQSIAFVMDDTRRVVYMREGDDFGDPTPALKYQLDDHLGSSNVLLDDGGTLVSREEYYPFGETSFGSYGKKRYRFCGKERDEESGMYYYGARYYAPWTCRFVSVDPLALKYVYQSPYAYADDNPICRVDHNGEGTEEGGGGGDKVSGVQTLELNPNRGSKGTMQVLPATTSDLAGSEIVPLDSNPKTPVEQKQGDTAVLERTYVIFTDNMAANNINGADFKAQVEKTADLLNEKTRNSGLEFKINIVELQNESQFAEFQKKNKVEGVMMFGDKVTFNKNGYSFDAAKHSGWATPEKTGQNLSVIQFKPDLFKGTGTMRGLNTIAHEMAHNWKFNHNGFTTPSGSGYIYPKGISGTWEYPAGSGSLMAAGSDYFFVNFPSYVEIEKLKYMARQPR